MWFYKAKPLLWFLPDSSKELEELRSAFTRALEYLKQEVEERKHSSNLLLCPVIFPVLSWCAFSGKVSLSLNYFLILTNSILKGFNESGDPSCMIMQNWARIEVNIFDTSVSFIHLCLIVSGKLSQNPSWWSRLCKDSGSYLRENISCYVEGLQQMSESQAFTHLLLSYPQCFIHESIPSL